MPQIALSKLLDGFEQMAREKWAYEWGAAQRGKVDCSGAFVYQYKNLNGPYIYHGSNRIARDYVRDMSKNVRDALPGMAAFKWKSDGAPDTYKDGLGNFYHIGLVSRSGKTVLNAKSVKYGFVESPITENWTHFAYLKDVLYKEVIPTEPLVVGAGIVNTKSGPLNLRDEPSAYGEVINQIPKGETVGLYWDKPSDGWYYGMWDGYKGYMSAKYIQLINDQPEPTEGRMIEVPERLIAELNAYRKVD